MSKITWVGYNEYVIGQSHPLGLADTINRPLREFLTLAGVSPDGDIPSFYKVGDFVPWTYISGTPTTLSGYGITDAAALNHTHPASDIVSGVLPVARGGTGLSAVGSNGDVLTVVSGAPAWAAGGGGGGAPTTPVSGALFLLEADAGISATDGNPVSAWNDQSGNGNNFSQATGSLQPIFRAQDIDDGIPYVEFDGTDDYLLATGMSITNVEMTIFAVCRYNLALSAGSSGLCSIVNNVNADWNNTSSFVITAYNQSLGIDRASVQQLGPQTAAGGGTSTQQGRSFVVFAARFRSSLIGAVTLSIWFKGMELHWLPASAFVALSADRASLGARWLSGAPSNYLRCDVRHLSYYETGFSDYKVKLQMQYLAHKYGTPTYHI